MKTTGLTMHINEYLPLRDVVFQTLRRAIITGELAPGERLMEISLANQLGVSRTPVREAIRKLELEGLVIMIPRKGAQVARITEDNLKDVIEIRTALEEFAVSLACERIDEEGKAEMKEKLEEFRQAIAQNEDILNIIEKDEQFHDSIVRASKNKRLITLLAGLREQFYRYRMEYVKDMASVSNLIEEHENMMHAIFNHDQEKATSLMKSHLLNQQEAILHEINDN
ncbi:MAG: GntR family transcriptional regulator [Eubacteriales bacterium]|nr:GntR family transcriptional regulator [Eubacteriales bacterium]